MDKSDTGHGLEDIKDSNRFIIEFHHYLSLYFIQAAAQFSKLSAGIEKNYDGLFSDQLFVEHRAYVIGSVTAAVSFLEATVNEFFQSVARAQGIYLRMLGPDVTTLIGNVWKVGMLKQPSFPVLEKYQIALALTEKALFTVEHPSYQDVHLLITLRNALVHAEPEPILGTTIQQNLEERLKSKQIMPNPLVSEESGPYFPNKCLSHGLANWAVDSSIRFTDEFFSRIGLQPNYDPLRFRLSNVE